MTSAPFLRLALIALCTAYVVAVVLVWRWLGVFAAAAAFFGGLGYALFVSIELGDQEREQRAATVDRLRHRLRFKPDVQRRMRERGEL